MLAASWGGAAAQAVSSAADAATSHRLRIRELITGPPVVRPRTTAKHLTCEALDSLLRRAAL